jgi:hypothetical protein
MPWGEVDDFFTISIASQKCGVNLGPLNKSSTSAGHVTD